MPPSNTGFDEKDKTTCMHLLGEHNYKQPAGYVHGRLSSHWGSECWIGPLCFHFTHWHIPRRENLHLNAKSSISRFKIPHLGITSHSISVVPPPEIITLWSQLSCHDISFWKAGHWSLTYSIHLSLSDPRDLGPRTSFWKPVSGLQRFSWMEM